MGHRMDCFTPALSVHMERSRDILAPLGNSPPQCLLFEGGTRQSRMALALWWAALLNCPTPPAPPSAPSSVSSLSAAGPCLVCDSCTRIGARNHSDILTFDGGISNKEDMENPGPVRAFTMDNVRQLKSILGDSPRDARHRVVILSGIDHTRGEAANALLKALEEPSPSTVFVLLSPQREQLLPTLVSRSWVLTLPWPCHDTAAYADNDIDLAPWDEALARFLQPSGSPHSGYGWLERTAAKGAVDTELAATLLMHCQKMLSRALCADSVSAHTLPPLARFFARLDSVRCACAVEALAQAQEALQATVNPARVLDWLVLQLYALQSSPPRGA